MNGFQACLLIAVIILAPSGDKPVLAQPVGSGSNAAAAAILRSDGLYNTLDTSRLHCGERISDRYQIYTPLFIINSVTALHIMGASFSGDGLSMNYLRKLQNLPEYVGTIKVEGKTLKATLPTSLYIRGMRYRLFCVHYEAEIRNRDTIVNWHMVPPYPKAKRKYNDDFTHLLTPQLLYFIEDQDCLGLDSLVLQRAEKQQRTLRR